MSLLSLAEIRRSNVDLLKYHINGVSFVASRSQSQTVKWILSSLATYDLHYDTEVCQLTGYRPDLVSFQIENVYREQFLWSRNFNEFTNTTQLGLEAVIVQELLSW